MASQTVQDTLKKVDQAMARLQEMQCTIVGGSKACGGVNLSPRSTRGYLRASLRCKEESLRLKELALKEVEETNPDKGQQFERVSSLRRSSSIGEESRRWSMPAVLIQQAVGEIMEASNFAKGVAYLVSHSDQNELTESPEIPWISNRKTLAVIQQQQNSDSKLVPHAIQTQDLDIEGKNGLQKFLSNKPDSKVHKFRVIAKDASSSLKCHRDAEKQQYSARARPELSELGMKVRSKRSFQVSSRAKEQGWMDRLILSPGRCSPPAKTINKETSSTNNRVKVEQIRPAQKGWMSRCNSTKGIMFPNQAFVPSPSKNIPRDRSTEPCMRRKSLPSLRDLTSSKTTAFSPFHKEKESADCMMHNSQNLRKSSSFSEAYQHGAAKLIKQSHIPSLFSKAMKKFHVFKASPASVASGHSSSHSKKTEPGSNPRLGKSESLRIFSTSQMPGCSVRRNSMSSYDRSASCKISHLSKQPIESLVQPRTPGWLPKKRSSNLMHSQPDTMDEDMASKVIVTEETEVSEEQVDYMPYERRQTERSLPNEKPVRKHGARPMEDYSLTSRIQTMANGSENKMLYRNNIQQYNNHLDRSNQGFLKPVDTNCRFHSFVRSERNMDASKEKLNKKKGASERKENRDANREETTGETNHITKNSSIFLGRSWSIRHEKLNNSTVKLPFFKNAKEWMKSQRSPSTINR